MKRLVAMMMAALLMLAGWALAEGSAVQRSGALAAYLDGEGGLYLPGNEKPINHANADALISIDPYRVLFTSQQSDGTRDLYMIDLGSFNERLVSKNISAACMADENTLYYVPGDARTQLKRMNLKTMRSETACTAAEPIDRMYNAADGLVFEQVDNTGTMIYNKLTGKFDSYLGALPTDGMTTDSFELYMSDGSLYIRDLTSLVSEHIDTGVKAYAVMNGGVYYLCYNGSATRLKCYDPVEMTWTVILSLDSSMECQLTASQKRLFMIDYRGQIYTVDIENGELRKYTQVPDTSTYDLPKGFTVSGLRIEAMDGQLNVYAELQEASAQPSFSFIEFTSTSDTDQPTLRLLERYAIEGETPAWSYLKPAEQYSPLARGSRGDAVKAIQKPLYALGYYNYYIDGIFGPRTQYAVRLLQSDLERPVTGVADSELQRMLLNGELPSYDAYLALTRGNRGLRVQIMQEKLRDLGYLGDAADGIFGANTQRAVQLFQSENGLQISEGATRETLKLLYSDNATRCASFIDLYPGYTGCRVRELNNRLQALYYLEYNPGNSYTADTAEAVRAFQRTAGLTVNGSATANVQRKLFSRYAPEAPGYITLRRGDDNDRVAALQRRLKELNYYSGAVDGYFGKATEKAVKLFQKKVELSATGVATVRTQVLLFRKDAPVYVKPTVIGTPVIGVEHYDLYQNGVYYINEDSADSLAFNWYVEGEVKEYGVKVVSADGRVLLDQKTLMSRTGVALATLELDKTYALTVTAYPEDGNKKHITADTVRFMRCHRQVVPEPQPVGRVADPEIFIKKVLRSQGGVQYVQPGEVAFHWHADGEVDRYYVEIFSSDGEALLTLSTRDEQTALNSAKLALGKTYTLFVYAIPARGTIENATTAAEHFALEDISVPTPTPEPEEPDITPEPVVTVSPSPSPDPAGADSVTNDPADAIVPLVEPSVEPSAEPSEEPSAEPSEEPSAEPSEVPTEEPTEEPAPEPEPVVESEPEPMAITPPVLSFETTVEVRDDITYVANDVLVMRWQPQEGVGSYYAEVVDGSGAVLAQTETQETFVTAPQGSMAEGEIYTLNVTANPADGGAGVTASARFALYPEPVVEEPVVEQPVVEEPVPEEPVSEEPVIEQPVVEEPIVEQSVVEEPVVEEPIVEEPVYEEPVVEEPVVEEPIVEQPPVEEPVIEEPVVEQPPVEEPVAEEPVVEQPPVEEPIPEEPAIEQPPVEEPVVEEPIPEEPVAAAPAAIDLTANPELTAQVQAVLAGWGWLAPETYEPGALNDTTLAAIAEFEAWSNQTNGTALASANGVLDGNTLALLTNPEGTPYPKPLA